MILCLEVSKHKPKAYWKQGTYVFTSKVFLVFLMLKLLFTYKQGDCSTIYTHVKSTQVNIAKNKSFLNQWTGEHISPLNFP